MINKVLPLPVLYSVFIVLASLGTVDWRHWGLNTRRPSIIFIIYYLWSKVESTLIKTLINSVHYCHIIGHGMPVLNYGTRVLKLEWEVLRLIPLRWHGAGWRTTYVIENFMRSSQLCTFPPDLFWRKTLGGSLQFFFH